MTNRFLPVLLVAMVYIHCDSHLADSPQPGFLKLSMTTDAGKLSISLRDTLLVNVASIRLWRGAERRDWAVISDTNRVYNLFEWTQGRAVRISNKELMYLPPGNFTRLTVRVVLQDTVMTLGGKKYFIQIPSEEYQIVNLDHDVQIVEGKTVNLELVFEAEPSLKFQLGRYSLVPTFRLTQQ